MVSHFFHPRDMENSNEKQPWHIRNHVLRFIEMDKYRALRKYHGTTKWWNPESAAFYNKVSKRFSCLQAMGNTIPEDKPKQLGTLFCAYASYRECIYTVHDKTPATERECYDKNLLDYLNPDSVLAKAQVAFKSGSRRGSQYYADDD